jgi:hypothetical protein
MWRFLVLTFAAVGALQAAPASEAVQRALQMEREGQPGEARALLEREAAASPGDADALLAYAEFLDRYRDPARWQAYERAYKALGSSTSEPKLKVARRLAVISLLRGDIESSRRYVTAYREAGGSGIERANQVLDPPKLNERSSDEWVSIPGPLFSFRRMAALSSDQQDDELFPALARNVVTNGYRATRGAETLEQTEYMKLVLQYLSQARELVQFAGADQAIDVPTCESQETAQLLKIIGFRLRNECGPDAVLETVNPSRAFLSIDSGFPLAEVEAAFRAGTAVRLPYESTQLPIVFGQEYWRQTFRKKGEGDFLEQFLNDPAAARLYVAMSRLHQPTARLLRQEISMERLKNYANVLDFFGGMFEIRDGKAIVPGGARTEAVWEDLVGVSPSRGAEFFQKLIEADDGWLASYFDSLARVDGAALSYFSEPRRMKRFYEAVRGRVTSPGPARPIFRANAELLMLTASLQVSSAAAAQVPGGLGPWKNLFTKHPHGKYDGKLTRAAAGWSADDDVVEAMFALTRKAIENEPLKIFLSIGNVDRFRTQRLSPAAVEKMILAYPEYGDQFSLFNDAPMLSEETIAAYLDLMPRVDKMGNLVRRSDVLGMVQGLTGLWQILRRQGQIPDEQADTSLRAIITPFLDVSGDEKLFDAGREGIRALLAATGSAPEVSPQDRLMELLAGSPGPGEGATHARMVERLNALFNQQRLVSIKTIFDLADHLERVSRGEAFNVAMANRLAASISEVRLPRSTLSSVEANSFAQGHWVEKHIQEQRAMNLRREVDRAQGRSEQLREIRGQLVGVLRDSVVGLNYVYYSPPGAELIRSNPLFVRSHNFLGYDGKRAWTSGRVQGSGWPNSGGGRILGSLINLPYSLADAEQNFLIPSQRQALIWQDLAPQILIGATVPRWWGVSGEAQHIVALHVRLGEELVAAAALDDEAQKAVFGALAGRVEPARLWGVGHLFSTGQVQDAVAEFTPAELYELAAELIAGGDALLERSGGPHAAEIRRLRAEAPEKFSYQRMASIFGTPHPELTGSYRPELLHLPLFPTMMGYSSRIMAESWESTNIHWATLADELYLPPAELNLLVPEWTQRSLERIFATHLEDWPALWRSMRIVGERYRQQVRPESGRVAASLSGPDAQ